MTQSRNKYDYTKKIQCQYRYKCPYQLRTKNHKDIKINSNANILIVIYTTLIGCSMEYIEYIKDNIKQLYRNMLSQGAEEMRLRLMSKYTYHSMGTSAQKMLNICSCVVAPAQMHIILCPSGIYSATGHFSSESRLVRDKLSHFVYITHIS